MGGKKRLLFSSLPIIENFDYAIEYVTMISSVYSANALLLRIFFCHFQDVFVMHVSFIVSLLYTNIDTHLL